MSLVISKDQASINREQGIARVQENMEMACPGWTDIALNAVIEFAKSHEHFLTEEVREYCHEFVPEPRDARAWGAVIRRAVKTNIIVRSGYAPARSSNLSPKPLWKSLIVS